MLTEKKTLAYRKLKMVLDYVLSWPGFQYELSFDIVYTWMKKSEHNASPFCPPAALNKLPATPPPAPAPTPTRLLRDHSMQFAVCQCVSAHIAACLNLSRSSTRVQSGQLIAPFLCLLQLHSSSLQVLLVKAVKVAVFCHRHR